MSNNDFVKGECRHCAGHLEFPADAAGQTIPCPHCGQPTELRAGSSTVKKTRINHVLLVVVLVIVFGLADVGVLAILKHKAHAPKTTEPAPTLVPAPIPPARAEVTVAPVKPATQRLKPGEEMTNDFEISPVQLQKTTDSSLVYVTGKVRNQALRQRFGVKVEFTLFDANGKAIGRATDYQSLLETNAVWDFKAMVMESKTVSARFSTIGEDQ